MSDEAAAERRRQADEELEREIRAGRKFNVAEAIGRMAGPGMMKGVSPVDRRVEAAAAIQDDLGKHLTDAGGVLGSVLLRRVKECDLLLTGVDHPRGVLVDYVKRVLGSEYELAEVVREADVEWGRVYTERPLFERPGGAANPDDPYTLASVRQSLTMLVERLKGEGA